MSAPYSMCETDDGWDQEVCSQASTMQSHSGGGSSQPKDNFQVKQDRRSSRLVFAALFLAAIAFGLATYFLLHTSQESQFEAAFMSFARETADIAENNAENSFGQLKSLSTAITSVSREDSLLSSSSNKKNASQIFPFVSIPHFDLRTAEITNLTGIEMILFVPFVSREDRDKWEKFQLANQEWIVQDYDYRGWDVTKLESIPREIYNYKLPEDYNETRQGFVDKNNFMEDILFNLSYNLDGFSAPVAQYGPGLVDTSLAMLDLFTHPIFKKEIISSLEYDVPVISETEDLEFLLQHLQSVAPNSTERDYSLLRSFTLDPVKEDFREKSRTIGYLVGILTWNTFFRNLLPANVNGIVVKVASDCGRNFTYIVNGGKEDWAKNGDWHDPKYEYLEQKFKFFWKDHPKGESKHCHFDFIVYPSDEFANAYRSNAPIMYAAVVVAVFVFTAIVFFLYDRYQETLQQKFYHEKERADLFITSLFPKHVAELLVAEQNNKPHGSSRKANKPNLHELFGGEFQPGITSKANANSKPLADFFPSATCLFADIVGFTAWSSAREPFQVFTLLETLYQAFDTIAKKRRIFKVETIGDCYVAVAGLPDVRHDHAPAMAKFAQGCLHKFQELVRLLEAELGLGTADLMLRTGLHSGPITAGVLRGERARFQLFGDTVNTTARIESTGIGGRIHLSQECADELIKFNKSHWVVPRNDKVTAKGKGLLTTFWLQIKRGASDNNSESLNSGDTAAMNAEQENIISGRFLLTSAFFGANAMSARTIDAKTARLIDWNTDILQRLLRQVVGKRRKAMRSSSSSGATLGATEEQAIDRKLREGKMVFNEVAEVIHLPKYDQASARTSDSDLYRELGDDVVDQIRSFVTTIAGLYSVDNPFHNFEHASHVTMSSIKLLSRIVAPVVENIQASQELTLQKKIHDHTYGITSDPLVQFACVFSSIVHDVEHSGVPNAQLVKEQSEIAARYDGISPAEQNSVDVAWGILMEQRFQKLRSCIYASEEEMVRFRQLVVNSVMATDIVDKDLKALRNACWEKAFQKKREAAPSSLRASNNDDDDHEDIDRKATIVIEHLIQASDVAHTMQHWHVYRKWNEKLFFEMYSAYKAGRSPDNKDPSTYWYQGEIGFFDFYIIPLAKKLKDCGVFGVSSDEYLNYALSNRREWEQKGQTIVEGYLDAFFFHQEEKESRGPRMGKQPTSSFASSTTMTDNVPTFEDEITEEVEV